MHYEAVESFLVEVAEFEFLAESEQVVAEGFPDLDGGVCPLIQKALFLDEFVKVVVDGFDGSGVFGLGRCEVVAEGNGDVQLLAEFVVGRTGLEGGLVFGKVNLDFVDAVVDGAGGDAFGVGVAGLDLTAFNPRRRGDAVAEGGEEPHLADIDGNRYRSFSVFVGFRVQIEFYRHTLRL